MKLRIGQMYGAGKAPSQRAFGLPKEQFEEVRQQRKYERVMARKPRKFQIGMVIGHLELLEQVKRKGYFGPNPAYMGGWIATDKWKVACQCGVCNGEAFEVTYQQLYRGMDRCKLAPKQAKVTVKKERVAYKLVAEHTRPPLELETREYGRLIIHNYVVNFGWVAECKECGDFSFVRYSRLLERYGRRPCLLTCLDRKIAYQTERIPQV